MIVYSEFVYINIRGSVNNLILLLEEQIKYSIDINGNNICQEKVMKYLYKIYCL